MKPTLLRCEYLVNPLGLDMASPRLSWRLDSDRDGARQTAYRILVSTSSTGDGDLWDTGKVDSDETSHIPYQGRPLAPLERAWWSVEVWDEAGASLRSDETAFWEAGIVDWGADWVGGDLAGAKHTPVPAPFLRKAFTVPSQPVWARLTITARGIYEARLNGRRVGEDVFAPGWTDYRHRIHTQTYDVTDLVQTGENALGAILGDGWYCGSVGMDGRQIYGDKPSLLARLVVRTADGSETTVVTDRSWRFAYGPIIEGDLLMGETYDARREFAAWDEPGFDDAAWRPVVVVPGDGAKLVGTRHPLVRVTQELSPVAEPREVRGWPASRWIFDLGQNMVGRVRLRAKGKAGETVRLRFAEVLKPNGDLYTEALRTARATDYYTFAGDGEITFEPRFTFHGFRYVEVSGVEGPLGADAITGVVLGSATTPTGTFECSDPEVNQLQSNITWGQRGNFLEVPTDCPQRDERLGWTGDAQVFVRTACHNMDVASFFTKWLQDAEDSQGARGEIPPVIPNPAKFGADGGPAWADAVLICPWTIYRCYGDKEILARHYDTYRRFVDFLDATSRDDIRCYEGYEGFRGFGDWLSTNAETPNDLIGTAFLVHSAHLMSRIADVLGKGDDAAKYGELSERAKQAFLHRYVTSAGLLASPTQTAYVLALHFDILPADRREEAVAALVRDIEKRGCHLSTGFVGTPYLQHVLTRYGKLDLAYRLLFQRTWPSWLYPVTQGATTVWERWDGWTEEKGFQDVGMNSFNHYAYGAVGDWLYSTVAGLDLDDAGPGYRRIVFRPHPGLGLTWAKATLESIRGRIESGWTLEDGKLTVEVRVPPNTLGTVVMPDGRQIEVGPGRHTLTA